MIPTKLELVLKVNNLAFIIFAQIMIVDKQGQRGSRRSDEQESPAATVSVNGDSHHSSAEVTTLKKMLTQRDNEISIL